MRMGIDVGGTFTDVILADTSAGRLWTTKVPTTPENPVEGALDGVKRMLELSAQQASDVLFLGHGTTIATNMIVEGKGASCALVTTAGFRDILEIRRAARHDRADLYDLLFENPPPLVARRHRLEIEERVLYDGSVETDLTDSEIARIIEELGLIDVDAVAVCLINAYVNKAHEVRLAQALRAAFPDRFISASHEVNPEIMEYERTSTTVINAQLGPRCAAYIGGFETRIGETGVASDILFMQSNGGLATPQATSSKPVTLLQSGPAGGVTAAAQLCARLGIRHAITGDMGGTTFDVSLIRDGIPEIRASSLLATHVVRAPTIDIESIGAGGGSIASVDASGGLSVGPQSAAADPGPACYGRGGDRPTMTDCNLMLGYISSDRFLGGGFGLNVDAATRIVEKSIGEPLGLDALAAARAVRSIANANMAQAIRLMTVGRGYDPREFAYICFGGGGPVHAVEIAEALGITTVIVPAMPGLFSAFGMIVADQLYDVQSTVLRNLDRMTQVDLAGLRDQLKEQCFGALAAANVDQDKVQIKVRAECRYIGQAEPLTFELAGMAKPEEIAEAFEAAHHRQWNFVDKSRAVQLVNLRMSALLLTEPLDIAALSREDRSPPSSSERAIMFGSKPELVPVFRRSLLEAGKKLKGPLVIDEDNSSFIVGHGWEIELDAERNIVARKDMADA